MKQFIVHNIKEIQKLMTTHNVEAAYLFGSAATETMKTNSDVDFLIRFSKDTELTTYAENYFSLMYALQDLLGCDVDLVEEKTIQNPYLLQTVNESKFALL